MNTIILGTRASKLALWQANFVKAKLEENGFEVNIKEIITKGDQILDRSLSKIGSKGLFTDELEQQLKTGDIHIAVHSAKDLTSSLPQGFKILAFTEREEAHDVIVSDKTIDLNAPVVLGTSSTRRVALLKRLYPNVVIKDMRGNLQTRIQKMRDGQVDALVLAFAGVHRMGYDKMVVHHLPKKTFVPPVGQGVLAIETHESLPENTAQKIKQVLNHHETSLCVEIEREFLRYLDGGCSIPVFAHAELKNNVITLNAGIVSLNGLEYKSVNDSVNINDTLGFGTNLATLLLANGGQKILDEIKNVLAK